MNANDYQRAAARTIPSNLSLLAQLNQAALGLAKESGEVADVVEKHMMQGWLFDQERVKEELGDVLWYIAEACTATGLQLSDVMQANIDKLNTRYADGHTPEASIARVDVGGSHAP